MTLKAKNSTSTWNFIKTFFHSDNFTIRLSFVKILSGNIKRISGIFIFPDIYIFVLVSTRR